MGLPVEVNNLMMGSLGGYTIGRSLRLRSSASAYLTRTPASAGNRTTWTYSIWTKKSFNSSYQSLLDVGGSGNGPFRFYNSGANATDTKMQFYNYNGSYFDFNVESLATYRDPSAWYHIVLVFDSTNATASNRIRFYINGVQQTLQASTKNVGSDRGFPDQNFAGQINNAIQQRIGADPGSFFYDGYIAEVNFIDGQALTPSSFGAYDTNGVWQPKKYTGTYGTNGFYLPFNWSTNTSYAGSFNGSTQYLTVPSNSAFDMGSGDFTIEAWVLTDSTSNRNIVSREYTGNGSNYTGYIFSTTQVVASTSGSNWEVNFTWSLPSPNQWHHYALVRNGNVYSVYIDGIRVGTQTVSGTLINGFGGAFTIGYRIGQSLPNGSISNLRVVKGTAVYTANFTPPTSALTAISGTSLLTLQNSTIIDNSTNAFTITNVGSVTTAASSPFGASVLADASGNNNGWFGNNINYSSYGTTYDSMIDSPTVSASASNYATYNPLNTTLSGATFSNANLQMTTSSAQNYGKPTIYPASGKWYYEFTVTAKTNSTFNNYAIYINTVTDSIIAGYEQTGQYYNGSAWNGSAVYSAWAVNGVIGVALDLDAGTVRFYYNGTAQGSGTISIGTGNSVAAVVYSQVASNGMASNFGQRPFTYTPPTGFNALNTYNLPAPSISNGAQYMAATTYTGTGATLSVSNSLNSVSFQPDFVWMKGRSGATDHALYDSVRGTTKDLVSNSAAAETTQSTGLTAFDSGGFTIGSLAKVNTNAATYVGWQWKGGGTGVTNNSGTITSTVSANPTAGFSIVTYTGTGANATVGHGLGVAPSMVIVKQRSGANSWPVYHIGMTNASYYMLLDNTNAQGVAATVWNSTAPTSSVFSIGTAVGVNTNAATYVAYCFAAVSGYSAFGKYTGNGSSDGPFTYTGFRPRWLLIKNISNGTVYWNLMDTSRSPYNVADKYLCPNASDAEATYGGWDILSNGFKIRNTGGSLNNNGDTYIYAAFAENPFSIARAR